MDDVREAGDLPRPAVLITARARHEGSDTLLIELKRYELVGEGLLDSLTVASVDEATAVVDEWLRDVAGV